MSNNCRERTHGGGGGRSLRVGSGGSQRVWRLAEDRLDLKIIIGLVKFLPGKMVDLLRAGCCGVIWTGLVVARRLAHERDGHGRTRISKRGSNRLYHCVAFLFRPQLETHRQVAQKSQLTIAIYHVACSIPPINVLFPSPGSPSAR